MEYSIPAAIAFFAAGANLLAAGAFLLLDPRSRAIRWYALFQADIVLWLVSQGWVYATGEATPFARTSFEVAVHMLPGLFVATSLVEHHDVRAWKAWGVVGLSLALLPLTLGDLVGRAQGITSLVWQLAGWSAGIAVHFGSRARTERMSAGARRTVRRATLGALGLGVPLLVAGGFLVGGEFFFVYAMPLVTVAIQLVIFFGIVHLRFYDIEVRSTRRGELAADAGELQRSALVGELAASFAHEVRNPLTGVRSLAQRLAEDEVGEPDRRRYAGVIVREVGRVEQIVADLLAFARRAPTRAPAPGPVELAPLFEDLRTLVASRAERAGVEVAADARGARASATREALAQALLNLLLNAIQHSPRGGRVDLAARAEGGAVLVVVRDQGPGVPAAERERVFDPFYSPGGGSGLGLAVVRRIATEAGWEVEVADAPGGGAEFRLRLPSAPAAAEVA